MFGIVTLSDLSPTPVLLNMFYIYILKSEKDSNLYIGSTNNLSRRLAEHNEGKVRSTKARRPFELRYYEAFYKEEDARHREWSLKKDGNALAQLKRRVKASLHTCSPDELSTHEVL